METSDSEASLHYLAGSSQHAFAGDAFLATHTERSHDTGALGLGGVAAGLGTMNHDFIIFGTREQWGGSQHFGLSAADRRHHVYVIGKTGSGKSTLLRNLIVQHLAAGDGVGLIDPHGDLAEELLHHIPPWRADHLCYFNPGDLEFPVGLNLMANVPRRSLEAVKRIIPGINGPTVIDIMNGGDRVAVHAVVDAATVYKTIGALKALDASGILVTRVERLMP